MLTKFKFFLSVILLGGYMCHGGEDVESGDILNLGGLQLKTYYDECIDLWDPTKSIGELQKQIEEKHNRERLKKMIKNSKYFIQELPLGTKFDNDAAIATVFSIFKAHILLKTYYVAKNKTKRLKEIDKNIIDLKRYLIKITDVALRYIPDDIDSLTFSIGGQECLALFDSKELEDLLSFYKDKAKYSSRLAQWKLYRTSTQCLKDIL